MICLKILYGATKPFNFLHYFLQPEDFWLRAAKKGIVVFALPGEPGLTELVGDFKIHFQDRQGDFYWCVNCLGICFFLVHVQLQ